MDKSSILIGTLLFALFMFPIFYIIIFQKTKEAGIRKKLNKVASSNNLKLDKFETFGHLSLALDSTSKKLLVYDSFTSVEIRIIDLRKVSNIQLSKILHPGRSKKERIIHLGLQIVDFSSSDITEIIFYDEDDYESTDAEIRLNDARKWDALLKQNLVT
ncbi:hypothetical protein [Christiangramia sabulilitoris]|uniref:Uncharacterized protein n=1 Tax=Christiangramia sabulilitoris TaxID=2583991 RepID=A0A550I8L7_9FLAO|nr:hypothetical protein [Christiangramia sabulilitoris]TRO67311.1 hypothetical protein FGM01_05360 [Christiangramia sabulilitoris]